MQTIQQQVESFNKIKDLTKSITQELEKFAPQAQVTSAKSKAWESAVKYKVALELARESYERNNIKQPQQPQEQMQFSGNEGQLQQQHEQQSRRPQFTTN